MALFNQSTLTPEYCRRHRLIFYPKTMDEAIFIQERLSEFSIRWVSGEPVGNFARECVDKGMLVDNGALYYNPERKPGDVVCDSSQFDKKYIPPDRAFLLEQFNKMAEKIDALSSRVAELESKVGEMHGTLFPTVEDTKPALKHKL